MNASIIAEAPVVRRSGPQFATPTVRWLLARSGELIRSHAAIFAVLAVWAFAPLVSVLVYVGQHGGVLTGVNGTDYFDQFQYLAWIRDSGSHFLASNLWLTSPTPHDYLQPMYAISGLLWRLGASIQLAYLIWKPVALVVLFFGFAAYVRHLLPKSRWQQAGALLLGLLYMSPVLALARWTGHLSTLQQLQLVLAGEDAYNPNSLWGFEHTAIAIGLMPVFLMSAERLLAAPAGSDRAIRGWTVVAAIAGLLVSWLHPWQGVTLLGIVGGLFVLKPPRRRYVALIVPTVVTMLPLIYGVLLARSDPSWRTFQSESTLSGRPPLWALLVSFGPLVAIAALGVRRPRRDRDWMLVLWVAACAAVYFIVPEFPPHALSGVTLPLAVLAVRGWQRLPGPGRIAVPIGVAGILAFTVPAAVNHAQGPINDMRNTLAGGLDRPYLRLTADQAAALDYIDGAPRAGAVLAAWRLSMSVPAFTGRAAYAGHGDWQPAANVDTANVFFSPTLNDSSGAVRRTILRQTKATFVIVDCGSPAALAAGIAPIARPVKQFGCLTIYETTP